MTIAIILITALISIGAFSNHELFNQLKFNAWLIKDKNQGWRFFTYAFVHAGWFHLLINMFVLWSFGRLVEHGFTIIFGFPKGLLYYILLYVGGIIFATLLDFGKQKHNPYYDAVGASGAVSAVLFSSIILAPDNSLIVFPIPFPVPAYIFGILYLIYSVYMGKQAKDNIGHNAHFLGAIFGIFFTIILKPSLFQLFLSRLF
ncbi:MAG: rhomboid family intramembrane serine protease [Bacteroidales bacterium]|nr:rhomboid family intramembrane serine protease [Bacteroidales bacterium]